MSQPTVVGQPQQVLEVTIPENAVPGQQLFIQTPIGVTDLQGTGAFQASQIQVTVPENAVPGQQIRVQFTAGSQPPQELQLEGGRTECGCCCSCGCWNGFSLFKWSGIDFCVKVCLVTVVLVWCVPGMHSLVASDSSNHIHLLVASTSPFCTIVMPIHWTDTNETEIGVGTSFNAYFGATVKVSASGVASDQGECCTGYKPCIRCKEHEYEVREFFGSYYMMDVAPGNNAGGNRHSKSCIAVGSYNDWAGVRCCSSDGSTCIPFCGDDGPDYADYETAQQWCNTRGRRLCTQAELSTDVCRRSGCLPPNASTWLWTSDPCEIIYERMYTECPSSHPGSYRMSWKEARAHCDADVSCGGFQIKNDWHWNATFEFFGTSYTGYNCNDNSFGWKAYIKQAYQKLAYGETSCPDGTDIQTQAECDHAVRSLGITGLNLVLKGSDIPRWCSVREAGRDAGVHFNPASSGVGRSDLAPICKACPHLSNDTKVSHSCKHVNMSGSVRNVSAYNVSAWNSFNPCKTYGTCIEATLCDGSVFNHDNLVGDGLVRDVRPTRDGFNDCGVSVFNLDTGRYQNVAPWNLDEWNDLPANSKLFLKDEGTCRPAIFSHCPEHTNGQFIKPYTTSAMAAFWISAQLVIGTSLKVLGLNLLMQSDFTEESSKLKFRSRDKVVWLATGFLVSTLVADSVFQILCGMRYSKACRVFIQMDFSPDYGWYMTINGALMVMLIAFLKYCVLRCEKEWTSLNAFLRHYCWLTIPIALCLMFGLGLWAARLAYLGFDYIVGFKLQLAFDFSILEDRTFIYLFGLRLSFATMSLWYTLSSAVSLFRAAKNSLRGAKAGDVADEATGPETAVAPTDTSAPEETRA